MRGKVCCLLCCLSGARITPAGAGKRGYAVADRRRLKDHPRRCGEKGGSPSAPQKPKGSPPQVRGKAGLVPCFLTLTGITPASAGKRKSSAWYQRQKPDHPRGCGEKSIYGGAHHISIGSPPQVRGKGAFSTVEKIRPRITPAGAGKRLCSCPPGFPARDHPRRCGEKPFGISRIFRTGGSPPQVRGKDESTRTCAKQEGITPAGAGKREGSLS